MSRGAIPGYAITTPVVSPASIALTTLAAAKCELAIPTGDTSDDASLARIITQASRAIAQYCNRSFGLATWQDELRQSRGLLGEGVQGTRDPLLLRQWPLVSVASVVETIAGVQKALVAGTDFEADYDIAALYRLSESGHARPWRAEIIAAVYQAGYAVRGEPWAVPAGGAVTVNAPLGAWNADGGVAYAGGGIALTPVSGTPGTGQYALVAGEPGNYQFASSGPDVGAGVLITYGYVPADVEDACLRFLTGRYKARGRDPLLRTEGQPGVGQEAYWIGSLPGLKGSMPAEVAGLLESYRVPVTA